MNLLGGGIRIQIESLPVDSFKFIENERLNFTLSVEGKVIEIPGVNVSDYHLLILPVEENNSSFFDLLFEQVVLLEKLTNSSYINSSILESSALLNVNYEGIYTVKYEWDTSTGFLVKKAVIFQDIKVLEVIRGIGYGYRPIRDFFIDHIFEILPIAVIAFLTFLMILLGRKKNMDEI
jgi:hypothetical protein